MARKLSALLANLVHNPKSGRFGSDYKGNIAIHRGYTNNDTLPEWGIQASYLGCLPAAGVLIALTANLERATARKDIYTLTLTLTLTLTPNANL